ncbi:MAG: hypothetical protein Q9191_006229 [Dirinaria sp. TL-2023a]
MSKRSWTEANSSGMIGSARHSTITRRQLSLSNASPRHMSAPILPPAANVSVPRDGNADINGDQSHADSSPNPRPLSQGSQTGARLQSSIAGGPSDETQITQPGITRKVKACAACRKQKVGIEYFIDCQVALIESKEVVTILMWRLLDQIDVSQIHAVLTEVCKRIDLAPPPPLQTGKDNATSLQTKESSPPSDVDQQGNYEPSPPQSPPDSALAQAPIESFRRIAQLASPPSGALSHDQAFERGRNSADNDLISKGIINVATAERLLHRYLQKLDPYIYGLGSIYSDLQTLRQASPALTACICTVAALHDERDNSELYEICNHEFRRIISKALFEKRDTQFLLALTIGSYWLSDIARILSGDAIRRAADLRLHRYYHQLVDSDLQKMTADASRKLVCGVRLWYLLYICDQHLAILYNQRSTMREQDTITGWEAYLESRQDADADSDMRISSQVALLLIMSRIRETFGSDTCEPILKASVAQLNDFSRQIDEWLSRWGTALKQHPIHRMAVGLDRKLQNCQGAKSEPMSYSAESIHPSLAFTSRESASYWGMDNGSANQTYHNQPPLNYGADQDFATLHDTSDLSLSFPAFGEFDYPDMRMNFLL